MNLRTPPSLPQPLIGVTGQYRYGHEVGRLPAFVGQEPIEVFLSPYIRSVAGAGGTPVLLTREADPVAVVDRLDALVLAGGEDVDPGRYGGIPTEFATVMDPGRDAFEIGLFEAALVKGIPVLGICRGCQLINVARGGTLVPHLSASDGQSHSFYGYPGNHRPQMVNVTEDSELSRVLGARNLREQLPPPGGPDPRRGRRGLGASSGRGGGGHRDARRRRRRRTVAPRDVRR